MADPVEPTHLLPKRTGAAQLDAQWTSDVPPTTLSLIIITITITITATTIATPPPRPFHSQATSTSPASEKSGIPAGEPIVTEAEPPPRRREGAKGDPRGDSVEFVHSNANWPSTDPPSHVTEVTEARWAGESQFGKAEGTGDVEKAEGTGGADPIAATHVAAVGPRTRERT